MIKKIYIFLLLVVCVNILTAQESNTVQFRYSGQLSGWIQYTPDHSTHVWLGGRYIPQLNISKSLNNNRLIDLEASLNIFGDMGFITPGNSTTEGSIKPYRAWARYSSTRSEVRLGLQKINFGSAVMFRSLMWFDTMDPRDPLQLTDGVWGGLFRYYFPNNSTLWLWSLYGNNKNKGWEIIPTSNSFPELGGRIQVPIPRGEGGLSYNYRKADSGYLGDLSGELSENRIGIDLRFDVTVGLWLEASWTHLNGLGLNNDLHLNNDLGINDNFGLNSNITGLRNQQMATLGTDYTFGIGNGLGLTFEQFFYSYSDRGIDFNNSLNLSGLSLNYPLTFLDNISVMVFYDWRKSQFYNFINWQHQLNNFTFYTIAYWNPKEIGIPNQMSMADTSRFAGKGIQLIVVWHH